MKKLLFIVLLIGIFACENEGKSALDLVNYVPQNTGIIVKVPALDKLKESIGKNAFLQAHPAFPLYSETKEKLFFLEFLNSEKPALITFSNQGRNEVSFSFITNQHTRLLSPEAKRAVSDSVLYDGYYIKKVVKDSRNNFFANIDSSFVLSDSKLIIENIIRQKDFPVSEDLLTAYQVSNNKSPSLIINHNSAEEIAAALLPNKGFLSLKKFAGWTSLDVEINATGIKLNGITTANGPDPQVLNIFKGVPPAQNEISKVAPLNARSIYSFTYKDFSRLKKNIEAYHINRESTAMENEAFFSLAKEIGIISFKTEKALVMNTTSITDAQEELVAENEVVKHFREIPIYNYSKGNIFREAFSPLVNLGQLDYYTIIDNFIIFAQQVATLEHIIANFQNQTMVANQEFYKSAMNGLSTESSILLISLNKNSKEKFSNIVAGAHREEISNLDFSEYPITALQFIYDKNFAHLHASFEKNTAKTIQAGTITQVASASLENNLATPPMLFTNHLNGQKEIVVQDNANQLYLISNSGKILWKKKLDGPILGEIHQVDLFKNNKYQLAFTTPGKFYVFDRLGNTVKPFPINFKNKVTQPLAVYDYDKIRNYRFVVVQNENLIMYDANGKIVSGFQFKRANGEITNTPKHIRIGTKDYILIPDAGGKLHIVDRQGNPRVKVSEKIQFSENDWFLHKNSFASTNAEGELLLINEKGEIKKQKLGLNAGHKMDATEKTFVSISENELHINDKEVELEYGNFSNPKIFYINDKIYVAVTDTQAHKVYIYDSSGNLLPNFPVYGNSAIALSNMDSDKSLEFAVQGEDNSILFYEIN